MKLPLLVPLRSTNTPLPCRSIACPGPFGTARRSGLTLVEMMVSIALTLIVVLAVIRLFDLVGSTVTESRNVLELSAQLRNVANDLQRDLDRATAVTIPPIDPDSALGFIEIIEGPDSDWDPQLGIRFDEAANAGRNVYDPTLIDPSNLNGTPTFTQFKNIPPRMIDKSGRYGDLDDVLMLTIRSDGAPFVGQIGDWAQPVVGSNQIQSEYALVVWWVEPYYSASGRPITLRLHRRQFLIRPDLNDLLTAYTAGNQYHTKTGFAAINEFLNENDLAVFAATESPFGLRAASMVDLANREKRYAHGRTNLYKSRAINFNHPADIGVARVKNQPLAATPWNAITCYPLGLVSREAPPNGGLPPHSDRLGQDVKISDIVAFDVKVYDPRAPLLSTSGSNPIVLTPHEIGYWSIVDNAGAGVLANSPMRGAFVDLFYARHFAPAFDVSLFSRPSHPNSRIIPRIGISPDAIDYHSLAAATYDTWSTGYERDGHDQDRDGRIDEGTDGLDGDNDSGMDGIPSIPGIVDDAGEKETTPPYPFPLREIEVTIRIAEPTGTQLVRQTSIVVDYQHE